MHSSRPDHESIPRRPGNHPPAPASERAALQDALARVAAGAPRWPRWFPRRRPGQVMVLAALSGLLLLSLLGIAAPWSSSPSPAQHGAPAVDQPALASPSPGPSRERAPTSRPAPAEAAESGATAAAPPAGAPECPAPLSVVAAPDIAGLVGALARPLGGRCPAVQVRAQADATTLSTMAASSDAPDVWIPGSSLWLQLAAEGTGQAFAAQGTSIARSPVVIAFPKPVYEAIAASGAWPVWLTIYDKVTEGEITRMSMPAPETTEGALALLGLHTALSAHSDHDPGATFLRTIHFRDNLAATDAHVENLLSQLAGSSRATAASQVGVFPATEQQLLAYNEADPAVPAVAVGMFDAHIEADYPLVISAALDSRQATLAGELLAQLRSPAAAVQLVDAGFRPPEGAPTQPAALTDEDRFPAYPTPILPPDPAGWQQLLDDWTWRG